MDGKTEGDNVASSSRFLPSLFLLNKIPKKDDIKEKRENWERRVTKIKLWHIFALWDLSTVTKAKQPQPWCLFRLCLVVEDILFEVLWLQY